MMNGMMDSYGGGGRGRRTPATVGAPPITGKTIIIIITGNAVDVEYFPGAWPPRAGRFRVLRRHS